jgi:hypothetical protein
MGLDMYLYAQTDGEPVDLANEEMTDELYESIHWRSPMYEDEDWYKKADWHVRKEHQTRQITTMAYWRKANQVHGWFVDNIQNGVDECQYAEVNLEQLAGLKTTCERLLNEPDLAETNLPPRSGFFFGSYEVDEWYMNDLKETIEQIEAIEIAERARRDQKLPPLRYWYHSSW